jgi:hypothetical protein
MYREIAQWGPKGEVFILRRNASRHTALSLAGRKPVPHSVKPNNNA